MSALAQVYVPPAEWEQGIAGGSHYINEATRAVHSLARGNPMVGALVPSPGLTETLARLPLDPAAAMSSVQASHVLSTLQPALRSLQLVSSVGALASVASLGVSCVGFAIVLKRLSRIEGKIDEALAKLDALKRAADTIREHQDALSLARLRSAADSLARAEAADTASARLDLARRARDLFQESRELHLALWQRADPWRQLDVPVMTALELQGRGVAAALGEIQAEFLIGDMGAFRQATKACAARCREVFGFDKVEVLRRRSDEACRGGHDVLTSFQATMPVFVRDLSMAFDSTVLAASQIENFAHDADLPALLELEPVQIVRTIRAAPGVNLYMLPVRAAYL